MLERSKEGRDTHSKGGGDEDDAGEHYYYCLCAVRSREVSIELIG